MTRERVRTAFARIGDRDFATTVCRRQLSSAGRTGALTDARGLRRPTGRGEPFPKLTTFPVLRARERGGQRSDKDEPTIRT